MPDQENTSREGENETSKVLRGVGRDKRCEWKKLCGSEFSIICSLVAMDKRRTSNMVRYFKQ